jgi:hypothetical protein
MLCSIGAKRQSDRWKQAEHTQTPPWKLRVESFLLDEDVYLPCGNMVYDRTFGDAAALDRSGPEISGLTWTIVDLIPEERICLKGRQSELLWKFILTPSETASTILLVSKRHREPNVNRSSWSSPLKSTLTKTIGSSEPRIHLFWAQRFAASGEPAKLCWLLELIDSHFRLNKPEVSQTIREDCLFPKLSVPEPRKQITHDDQNGKEMILKRPG